MTVQLGNLRLEIGDRLKRGMIHAEVSGQQQSGIVTPRSHSLILIFSGAAGADFGYSEHDGMLDDGSFNYTGEGQKGDQVFKGGNKAIITAMEQGKTIHLFLSIGVEVEYRGELELGTVPFRYSSATDVNGNSRKVIVFNFIPASGRALEGSNLPSQLGDAGWAFEGWKELDWSDYEVFESKKESTEARSRVEFRLTQDYAAWMSSLGHRIHTARGRVNGGSLVPDMVIDDLGIVVEAKRSSSRGQMRTAIGQVLDYKYSLAKNGHIMSPLILVPDEPSDDILGLCRELGISVTYRTSNGFLKAN